MKTSLWILAVIAFGTIFLPVSFAATLDRTWPQNPRVYDSGAAAGAVASCIKETSDGGFVLAGDRFVMKLDAVGNIDSEWDTNPVELVEGAYGYGGQVVQDRGDGGYVACTGDSKNLYVFRLDSRGAMDKAWNPNPQVFDATWVASLQQTTDGGFLVLADTLDREDTPIYLLKLDAQGNLDPTWDTNPKTYGVGESTRPCSIRETRDGGFIMAGYVFNPERGYLIKLDLQCDRDPAWEENPKFIDISRAFSIEQTQDGGYVVGGGAGVVKLTSDGNLDSLWATNPIVGSFGVPKECGIAWVHQTANGGYLVAGTVGGIAMWPYAFLARMDCSGIFDPDWRPNPICLGIGCSGTQVGTEALAGQETRDGGCILAGWEGSLAAVFRPGLNSVLEARSSRARVES